MAKIINVKIAALCHFYWQETNPGTERFYRKLPDRAFSQVLLHKISKCTWDSSFKVVTLLSAQSEMSLIMEFEQQDWVNFLTQDNQQPQQATRKHVDPNVAFPFKDDFSVGNIHGTNAKSVNNPTAMEIVEIQDNNDDTYTLSGVESEVAVGNWVVSSSNPVSGQATNLPQPRTDRTPTASGGSHNPASTRPAGRVAGGPIGK